VCSNNYYLADNCELANVWDNDWWKNSSGLTTENLQAQQIDSQGQLVIGKYANKSNTNPELLPFYHPDFQPLSIGTGW
jgi:hypothetical protein